MKLSVLSQVPAGRTVRVVENQCDRNLEKRLEDLGLIPGAEICCLHRSPSGSPAAYDIQGAAIALRKCDAEKIWVEGAT